LISLVSALALTRIFAWSFAKVGEPDALTCVTVTVVRAGAGMLAGYLPARKALRMDPVLTLALPIAGDYAVPPRITPTYLFYFISIQDLTRNSPFPPVFPAR
jgi:hypothetical protein